ncbi:MAG: hypothetical protein KDK70_36780 [Myxococcales bacterium]|nr:hypothetical protein [Myxococcales bacterium]
MRRHRIPGLRVGTFLGALALVIPRPTVARAAPSPDSGGGPATAEAPASAEPLDDAQRLYNLGRAKFETADYAAAIELWTEAYAIVPDTADGNQVKVLLIFNIATAREKAFDVDRDPAQLRQAKILLGNFEASIDAIYVEGDEAEAERHKVQQRIAEIDARLAAYEQEQRDGAGDDHDDHDDQGEPPPPASTEPTSSGRGLIIGGAVAAGLGVGGLALMAAGLGMGAKANDISDLAPDDIDGRRDRFDRGRTGNALALAGGIAGGVLVVTGAVLLGLGVRKRQRGGRTALVPTIVPQGSGLALRGRF